MSKYKTIENGDIFQIHFESDNPITMHFACCDCGLVHDLKFTQNTKGEVFMQVFRNEKRTAQKRRYLKQDKP